MLLYTPKLEEDQDAHFHTAVTSTPPRPQYVKYVPWRINAIGYTPYSVLDKVGLGVVR